jgi:hypothetical protein
MERTPDISTPSSQQEGHGPSIIRQVTSENLNPSVTLTVARAESTILGHVIVTFAKKGNLSCKDLLNCPTTFALLSKAEDEGVDITEPALLATIDDQGVGRSVYLTPRPDPQFRDFAVWIGNVTETLSNLKTKQVGLYLCKDSLDHDSLNDLVCQVIRSLVEAGIVQDICLIVGRHGYNDVLATALSLKHELDGPRASIHVLH